MNNILEAAPPRARRGRNKETDRKTPTWDKWTRDLELAEKASPEKPPLLYSDPLLEKLKAGYR